MNTSAPKENANPTIRSVDKERSQARRKPLEWSQLGNFQQEENDWFPTTPEDRSVFHALIDTSKATNGKGVTLLQNAGLVIPKSTKPALTHPQFFVSGVDSEPARTSQPVERDSLDAEEVFDIIRNIQDPEHPHTLEQLGVVNLEHIEVHDPSRPSPEGAPSTVSSVNVRFTPTIPHCSMATLIGLCLRVKLLRSLPSRFKINVQIEPGTHASENAINKQLRDKERVCAALENKHLAGVVNKCIRNGMQSTGH